MEGAPDPRDRVTIPADGFLRTTRQLWKLAVGTLVLPLPTVALAWWSLHRIRPDQPTSEMMTLLALLVAFAGAIVLLLASVRCPRCRARLLGAVVRQKDAGLAITSFLQARVCPHCGYDPRAQA